MAPPPSGPRHVRDILRSALKTAVVESGIRGVIAPKLAERLLEVLSLRGA
jgi:hypothetical protein